MSDDIGVPPSGSGYSAEPEPSCTVSAVPVSIPNAGRYLLVKRGLYYRPDSCGYTGIKDYAGRYSADAASPESGVTAIHEDEAPLFAENCFDDIIVDYATRRIADLELALDLACRTLGDMEPGDSRAVSDEFVSMASVLCKCPNDEARQILRGAIAKHEAASADTHPKDGDVKQAPLVSGAVPKADAQKASG